MKTPNYLLTPTPLIIGSFGPIIKCIFMPERPKLFDQVRNLLRLKHMSHKTERASVGYIREYVLFHNKEHPKENGRGLRCGIF